MIKGTIKTINELLSTKQLSCVELTQQYLDAIARHNDTLNAYVKVTPELALSSAKKIDEKIAAGIPLGPLAGVPMTLKDNISTKGIETTCCSKMLENYVPIYDATVWELLQNQGAVLLGKTNMDEFAMGSTCETSYFGGAKNPHNTGCVAGGSSGGGASAVGGNLAAFALGSDTGGSIRQPASFCGVVGFKPTYGSVSRYGLIAFASSFDQIGPITTTVEDAAMVFDAISLKDAHDSTSQGCDPTVPYLGDSLKGRTVGVIKEYFEGIGDDINDAVHKAIQVYRSLGAEVKEFSMPEIHYGLPVYYILACAEASSNLGRYDGIRYGYKVPHYNDINEMICRTRSEGFGEEVKHRILLGTYVLSAGYYDAFYKKAQSVRGKIVASFEEIFRSCDFIVAPTVPMTAFESGHKQQSATENYLTDICTVPVNIAGLPAISVPCGFDKGGMPIGLQIIGQRFDEATVLNAAYQYEAMTRENAFKVVEMGVRP
ncbi:MAG: Asp-tRNA(Asn)/Glu-tRNA(Gln) amidotransferase subunit GatA [Oscillospiraceae bacterium]|nr:Asp-tRNA(Asn)/Glu-tRNA(Gln) amidotransferase subunit GatA [Oscillospiraceae bacterium]